MKVLKKSVLAAAVAASIGLGACSSGVPPTTTTTESTMAAPPVTTTYTAPPGALPGTTTTYTTSPPVETLQHDYVHHLPSWNTASKRWDVPVNVIAQS